MDELLQAFLVEANEHLDQAERDLVLLEQNPADRAALDRVFRAVHTIKGNSGFLELPRVERLAHAAESALERLRAGEAALDAGFCDLLLRAVDGARGLLAALERGEAQGGPDIGPLVAALARAEETRRADAVAPVTAARATARRDARTVRVDVRVLDRIMDLVGELVLARNRALARGRPPLPPEMQRIATGLQEAAQAARMEPVGRVWERFPRMVRDIANRLGKRVRLTLAGRATELDRTVLEAIADPLVHLVRNSIDHGIETPAERAAAGKAETGTLHLSAGTDGAAVVIEIRDDGRGLDPERIRARAVARGLADAATPDQDVLRCVFEPGFSTADSVTDLSGRGVGLDVVQAHVERLGGAVELSSERGAGTRVRLRLPLVLAIAAGTSCARAATGSSCRTRSSGSWRGPCSRPARPSRRCGDVPCRSCAWPTRSGSAAAAPAAWSRCSPPGTGASAWSSTPSRTRATWS